MPTRPELVIRIRSVAGIELSVVRNRNPAFLVLLSGSSTVNVADSMDLVRNGSYFYLLPDDIVYIPATPLSDAAHIAQQVADVLFFRGWSAGLSWELNP